MISVIVPNYNHEPFLRQRIDSILNQTYQDFELILLDDCSTDGSRDVIESYRNHPRVSQIVFNEKNAGTPFRQWNKGIELAKGEWIWIAESDDYADPHFLETLMTELHEHPQCGFAYTWTYYVDTIGEELWSVNETGLVVEYKGDEFIREKLFLTNSVSNVSECVFRKDLYSHDKKFLYDDMKLCGDWFFYVLLAEKTNVLEVQKKLSYYRVHDSNTSNKADMEGATFFESERIYNYLKSSLGIGVSSIRKPMAKKWLSYKKKFNFSRKTNKKILRVFLRLDPCIVFLFKYYCLRSEIKKILCRK